MQMVERVHQIIEEYVREGDVVVDATVGNGWDTLKLCQQVGESGKVYGFDIQKEAIQKTRERLEKAGVYERTELICCSHAKAQAYVKEPIKAFMMNLGYLPGGQKDIVTNKDSTVEALCFLSNQMVSGGIGTILVYYGHEGGMEEKTAVEAFMASIPSGWGQITRMEIVNRKNSPPILYIMEKK
ncbi:MAG: class I SAM-dependent methyltransferase [Lachnospiraceae bacterium]|nr:class I SAM-dependent methyltransferase [Lachnospiraceae bacterium]